MSNTPRVSVLMGVYNEEEYLERAIESVLEGTYENLEFVIVDDASTDRSAEIVRSYDDPRIVFLENDTNRGLTVSLNRGLERATGKYIARQDADDVSEPDRLARQVAFLERNEEVAVVGSGAYLIDGDGGVIDQRVGYCSPSFSDFLEKSHLVHGSIVARRSVLQEVGGYDELFRYGQDYDLWLRLVEHHRIANVSDPLYRLRIHDESVYFSRKDESALYGMLARDLATGRTDEEIKEELAAEGIERYYDYLGRDQQIAFHKDLATRYLRYGHTEPALEECRKVRRYGGLDVGTALLTLLGHAGADATTVVRWGMRRYLNLKTRLHNYRNCPYETGSTDHPGGR